MSISFNYNSSSYTADVVETVKNGDCFYDAIGKFVNITPNRTISRIISDELDTNKKLYKPFFDGITHFNSQKLKEAAMKYNPEYFDKKSGKPISYKIFVKKVRETHMYADQTEIQAACDVFHLNLIIVDNMFKNITNMRGGGTDIYVLRDGGSGGHYRLLKNVQSTLGCPPGKVRNPRTGKCINRDGKLAKSLGLSPNTQPKTPKKTSLVCPPGKIRNPKTGRCIAANGKLAKELGLSPSTPQPTTPSPKPTKTRCPPGKVRNPKTGRCIVANGKLAQQLGITSGSLQTKPVKPVITPKAPCPPGKIRSEKTNRCINIKVPGTFLSGTAVMENAAFRYLETKFKECFIKIHPRQGGTEWKKNMIFYYDRLETKPGEFGALELGYPTKEFDRYTPRTLYQNYLLAKGQKQKLPVPGGPGKMFVHENVEFRIEECLRNSSRFIVIPLRIRYKHGAYHLNMVIYDKQDKTAERYEPHGSSGYNDYSRNSETNTDIDDTLLQYFMDKGFIARKEDYYSPIDVCPNWPDWKSQKSTGHQYIQNMERMGFGGSCATWAMWYVDYRLSHPNKSRGGVLKDSFDDLKKSSPSFTKFIKTYFAGIYKFYRYNEW